LADPPQVWATGRTVQCAACGQRWRAVGEGVRPAPEPEASAPAEPAPRAETNAVPDAPVEAQAPVAEAPAGERVDQAEAGPPADPEPGVPSADWHATPPASDESLSIPVFRPPPRLTTAFGSGPSRAGRWLAIAFLVMIALFALVVFRDVIVAALPGLAPMYAAMGLLVHPAAVPHG
jgi:hypothetical protein